LKFKVDFHTKMIVCRHELGGGGSTPTSRQFQPCHKLKHKHDSTKYSRLKTTAGESLVA